MSEESSIEICEAIEWRNRVACSRSIDIKIISLEHGVFPLFV